MTAGVSESSSRTDHNVTGLIFNITHKTDPSQCLVLQFEGVTPWDNPDSLVSARTEDLVHRVTYSVVLPLLFLIGGPANVINMAVFYRQGLKERINVCLFSLSLADFLYLLFNMIIYGEQMRLQFVSKFTVNNRYDPVMRFVVNYNLLGFNGFTWVSQVLSAIIASERCFCILQPLRSQTVLSTSTTTIVITFVNVVIVGLYSVVVSRYRVVCAHDLLTNSDIWTVIPSRFYFDYQSLVDFLDGVVFGLVIPVVVMVVVAVTTIVTMIKLHQAAAWRAGISSGSSASAREMALTVMLVYISIFFVVCVFPITLFRVVWLFLPELNAGRRQHNLFFVITWLIGVMTHINSTFNILIYYSMGSRYRQTFWQLMGRAHRTPKISHTHSATNNTVSLSQ